MADNREKVEGDETPNNRNREGMNKNTRSTSNNSNSNNNSSNYNTYNSNLSLRNLNSFSSTNSQITETKNKQGIEPLTERDLVINKGEDLKVKVEEFMTRFVNNVFENKSVLYLYCKYVMLHYGKDLIDERKIDSLNFGVINGGITNILVKVEDQLEKKKYLIRLYGPKTSEIINREREKKISSILYDKNISKKIYVFFPNGRIEEFMDGYALTRENIKDSNYQKKIAQNLRVLHDINLNDTLFKDLQSSQNVKGDRPSFLWSTIWKYFNLLKEEKKKNCSYNSEANILKLIDFDMLKVLILEIEELCNKKQSPVVLCHCDLLSSNIINTTNDNISFIDFEYSCPMERAYDIANHFNEYAGFNCDWELIPSRDEEYNFIKNYLNTEDEDAINNLIDEIQPFYVCSHINWGLWALLQGIHSVIDFDFINYGMTRITASCLPIFRSKLTTS
ncbi:ethanolamine kinase, putative [Plasmodium malariae]|uniref:ethanolamine kinase n=1 Tax=Plasmodium malariae TaxID=5858 RepID=A0A1C3KCM1_PLAMA|nr:ethanolamine kinase, putative [Plasmodium malariae]